MRAVVEYNAVFSLYFNIKLACMGKYSSINLLYAKNRHEFIQHALFPGSPNFLVRAILMSIEQSFNARICNKMH